MRILIVICLMAGCKTSCPPPKKPEIPIAPPVRVVTVRVNCIDKSPPVQPESFKFEEDGCPGTMGGCLTPDALRSLIIYLSDLQKYSSDSWIQCGPSPKETP